VDGIRKEVDCRPSDALALAARAQVPIMVAEEVMDQAGIIPEEDISDAEAEEISEEEKAEIEKQDLDVFEDFLQNFDINDLTSDSDEDEEED
jgi:bifunctional DNase/RNase